MLGSWGRPLRRLERRPHVLGQRLQLTLVIAGHVVQRLAMPCSKSSKGRISSSTTALESSRISGRASASFAVSVLSHVFRSGECSRMWRLPHLAIERALMVASGAGDNAGDEKRKKKGYYLRERTRALIAKAKARAPGLVLSLIHI